LKVGRIFLIVSTLFLCVLIALKYPFSMFVLISSSIVTEFINYLDIIKNFVSSNIWQILVYVISFIFFILADND